MIKSFRDADTELLWNTGKSRRVPASLRKVASRKLAWWDSASNFDQLRIPPANHLEALTDVYKRQMQQRANVARPAAANQYHQTTGVKAGPEALLSGERF